MAEREWVGIEINGQTVEFLLWPSGTEYDVDASDIAAFNIGACIDALEKHSECIEGAIKHGDTDFIDLTIELGEERFPWEKNLFAIIIHRDDTSQYVAEFSLNTATGALRETLRDAVLPVLGGTQFAMTLLEPAKGMETPLFEEDGWHQWTCWLSSFPETASFKDLFAVRRQLSQAAFLPHDSITSPYVALRMVQLGQAHALIGREESEWLEAKSCAYELRKIHESLWKQELAEDVAQFANTDGGGLLVIGLRTKRKAGADTIDAITPIPLDDRRLQVYRDTLRKRIYPPISGLLIDSHPWNSGQIVSIFVPPQTPENQPYLVSGSVACGRFIRSGITIVRRQGDASIPITAPEIHSALVAGRAFLRGAGDK